MKEINGRMPINNPIREGKNTKVDFSRIRTVNIHKQQFDAIKEKANYIILTCKEDGRVIAFQKCEQDNEL